MAGLPAATVYKFSPEEEVPATIFEMNSSSMFVAYKPARWTMTTSILGKKLGSEKPAPRFGAKAIQAWLQDTHGTRFPFLLNARYSNGMAHRLDVETSGPFIVATSMEAWQTMRGLISTQEHLRKEYVALMHGSLPLAYQAGTLKYPLKTTNRGVSLYVGSSTVRLAASAL